MAKPEDRAARRKRHVEEVEQSHAALRNNIAEAGRLVDASDAMLKRHRKECEDDEEGLSEATKPSSGGEG
jgi:hypothetical protein